MSQPGFQDRINAAIRVEPVQECPHLPVESRCRQCSEMDTAISG
jgi:hypothetical protein